MDLEAAEGILEWTSKVPLLSPKLNFVTLSLCYYCLHPNPTQPEKCRVALPSKERYVPAIFFQDVRPHHLDISLSIYLSIYVLIYIYISIYIYIYIYIYI